MVRNTTNINSDNLKAISSKLINTNTNNIYSINNNNIYSINTNINKTLSSYPLNSIPQLSKQPNITKRLSKDYINYDNLDIDIKMISEQNRLNSDRYSSNPSDHVKKKQNQMDKVFSFSKKVIQSMGNSNNNNSNSNQSSSNVNIGSNNNNIGSNGNKYGNNGNNQNRYKNEYVNNETAYVNNEYNYNN